ncbi:hypothetical protein MACH23_37370 [Sulfitobacter pontiacus]|nr:hypothetical protein MACH23_37370 [Sulfitobacter pontiacus]
MAGGSTGFGNCQGWGERALARRSPALSIAQSDTGALPGSLNSIEPYLTRSYTIDAFVRFRHKTTIIVSVGMRDEPDD